MSNITTSHPTRGTMTPVYTGTGEPLSIKGVIYPTLTTGKVLSAFMIMLMLATPLVAIMHQSQQQYLITQPSISAISETVKK